MSIFTPNFLTNYDFMLPLFCFNIQEIFSKQGRGEVAGGKSLSGSLFLQRKIEIIATGKVKSKREVVEIKKLSTPLPSLKKNPNSATIIVFGRYLIESDTIVDSRFRGNDKF
ncbi:MAG: hypothetical protein NTW79_01620 [Candidatus Berkelbacteria bacterium]|nr:hypothetical protein [Candidatus Berkelbacteria bacterium]